MKTAPTTEQLRLRAEMQQAGQYGQLTRHAVRLEHSGMSARTGRRLAAKLARKRSGGAI